MSPLLPRRSPDELRPAERQAVPDEVLAGARDILDQLRAGGEPALRALAEKYGDREAGQPLTLGQDELRAAYDGLPSDEQELLQRVATRIRRFSQAQRDSVQDMEYEAGGLRMGHRVSAVDAAGCYVPGGRYPLPSTALMTAIPARVAGVASVWIASPRPAPVTLAAAHVAGADGVLAVGGAQAIGALAWGVGGVPRCDVLVGPGNQWVTAAKQLLAGERRIDMLAGPSELLVIADGSADPALVAADLLAQAEHDPEAVPGLLALDGALLDAVDAELERQLATLDTADIARRALANGFACAVDAEGALAASDALAPEHLELLGPAAEALAPRLRHFGGLFVGSAACEVLGDYGAGPNHTLPTGGTGRARGGLAVFDFLRWQGWMEATGGPAPDAAPDAAALARLEGLHGHEAAARLRG